MADEQNPKTEEASTAKEPENIVKEDKVAATTATDNAKAEEKAAPEIVQEKPGAPQETDEKLEKINRAFKERETAKRAQQMGMSYVNIGATPINPDLLRLIEPETARRALILPFFKIGKKVRLAVSDPENADTKKAIDDLKKQGYAVNINLATDDGLLEAMQLYETEQYKVKKEVTAHIEEEKLKGFEAEITELQQLEEKIKTATSEEALYLINVGALKAGASDIHYEPEEHAVRVRFRIDGILHDIFKVDPGIFLNIANQIKYQSKLKINITNETQDGRYSFKVNERKVDLRVSILPTQYGETYVCRLLDSERHVADFEDLGYTGYALTKIKKLLTLKHGMILVTGPTGSGKTTALYTLLEKFNSPEVKVITLEDPVEYHLKGISQSQINEKRGYDFSSGLRAILRQDPDIVMVGEIRDLETAETAAQAALTGHVLLSTLHTNSAIETIPRLINIGLPPFMIAPALDTIIAQRLVRKFCPDCSELKTINKSKMEEMQRVLGMIKNIQPTIKTEIPEKLPVAKGCDKCSGTGYKGRISIIEVLEMDNEIRDLILDKASSMKLIESARRKGMLTMYEDGILKVIQGVTSLAEVHRVTTINA